MIRLATCDVAASDMMRTNTRISLKNENTLFLLISLFRPLALIGCRSLHSLSDVQIDLIDVDYRL
jgi:hypothetical protein